MSLVKSTTGFLSKVSTTREEVDEYIKDNIKNGETDSIESLKEENLDISKKSIPSYNIPASERAEFPEEYEIETRTGLVKAETLHKLNRLDTRISTHSSKPESVGSEEQKLRKCIEKNQKEIDNYKHRSGFRKFIGKLFG